MTMMMMMSHMGRWVTGLPPSPRCSRTDVALCLHLVFSVIIIIVIIIILVIIVIIVFIMSKDFILMILMAALVKKMRETFLLALPQTILTALARTFLKSH